MPNDQAWNIVGPLSVQDIILSLPKTEVGPPTGDVNNGDNVVVTGSGFGTKAIAKPLVYDNFEAGTVGNPIAGTAPVDREIGATWVWDEYLSGTQRPLFSNEFPRGVSTKHSKHHFETSSYNVSLEIFKDFPNSGDRIYFSFWYRYERRGANYSRNMKPWVVYGSDQGVYPSAYIGCGEPPSDGGMRNAIQDTGTTDQTLWGGPTQEQIGGEWRRFEQLLVQCTPGVQDGMWRLYSHDPAGGQPITIPQEDLTYRQRAQAAFWRQWHFGSYHDNDATGTSGDVYLDEIYFDNSFARVEIGDAPVFSNCTHREIQVALSWSDTSVTFRANKGSFLTGQTCYVFVMDSSDVPHSAGTVVWG